jgi:hypothetical protein
MRHMAQERGAFKVHCKNRASGSGFKAPIGKQIRVSSAHLSLDGVGCRNLNHLVLFAYKLGMLPLCHTFSLSK